MGKYEKMRKLGKKEMVTNVVEVSVLLYNLVLIFKAGEGGTDRFYAIGVSSSKSLEPEIPFLLLRDCFWIQAQTP